VSVITEENLREIIRVELIKNTKVTDSNQLNEQIMAALKQIVQGLGQMLGIGFEKASSTYDPSKYGIKHATGKSVEELEPKTDPYDQVYALSRVMWHIGAGIDLALQNLEYAAERGSELEFPDQEEEGASEEFIEKFNQLGEYAAASAGYLREYLSQSKSNKIEEIGLTIEPQDTISDTLKSLAEGVTALEGANAVSDWEKILGSAAVGKVLEGDDEAASSLQSIINETKGDALAKIGKTGDLKTAIDEVYQIALDAEKVIDTVAVETGAKPEESELLDHFSRRGKTISEAEIRVMIRKSIKEKLKGNA